MPGPILIFFIARTLFLYRLVLLVRRQRLEPRRVDVALPHPHVLANADLDALIRERA